MKRLLSDLNARNPNIKGNMLAALSNVRATHLHDLDLRARLGMEVPTGFDETVV